MEPDWIGCLDGTTDLHVEVSFNGRRRWKMPSIRALYIVLTCLQIYGRLHRSLNIIKSSAHPRVYAES
jgi:hypothetical protein